jgi:hypothetical protein
MFKFILQTIFQQYKMHESTLDLFCGDDSNEFADEYAMEIERKAAELEVTVDYYIAEFL